MRKSRALLLLSIALVCMIVAGWLWWVKPRKVDMAAYAPADSLLYLEANQPIEVISAIAETDAWRALETIRATSGSGSQSRLLQRFVAWTGIGPIQSVILSRAQVAAVITDLGTIEEGDTLNIRPEAVLLVETHTAESRIRPPFEQAIKALAEKTYGQPVSRRITLDGIEFIEFNAAEGSRQIVGTVIGSLVIVGNSERAVQNCVAVSLGRQPNLQGDPELAQMRLQLGAKDLLTFGYVPAKNSARLLAVGLPLLMGRAPGDSEFQRLITTGAAKIFGSLGWSSRPYLKGIQDRYLITLQPSIVARLKPGFGPSNITSQMQQLLADDLYSVTSYRFANAAATWQSLKTAVSSQVDTLSTVVFSSLLKTSLLSYGVDDPESFLGAVNGELLTVRFDEAAERSILIGSGQNRGVLRDLVTKKMGFLQRSKSDDPIETFEDAQGEFAACFIGDFVVLGSSPDVRRYVAIRAANTQIQPEKLKRITFFGPSSNSANIVTYTDDTHRVRSFVAAVLTTTGRPPVPMSRIEEAIAGLPFSVTETTLHDSGLERTTRSPLGQFSTVLPLLIPEQSGPPKAGTEAR